MPNKFYLREDRKAVKPDSKIMPLSPFKTNTVVGEFYNDAIDNATPQPITGEASIAEWLQDISTNMKAGDRYSFAEVVELIGKYHNQAASRPTDAFEFGDLIEDAVNAYFHQAEKELGRKDLGYIEERNWQKIKNDCQRFFTNSKSPNPNK